MIDLDLRLATPVRQHFTSVPDPIHSSLTHDSFQLQLNHLGGKFKYLTLPRVGIGMLHEDYLALKIIKKKYTLKIVGLRLEVPWVAVIVILNSHKYTLTRTDIFSTHGRDPSFTHRNIFTQKKSHRRHSSR